MSTGTTNDATSSQKPMHLLQGVTKLTHLGVIKIDGEDAAKFIHGQLTQDFSLLDMNVARLAAFCSINGRMRASFIGFKRRTGEILLVCSQDLLKETLGRLSLFVLRAKARLSNASQEYALYGLVGDCAKAPALPADAMWSKSEIGEASVIRLYPVCGIPRCMWIVPVTAPAPQGLEIPLSLWLWSEVLSAVVTISAPIADMFIPQMLNYESVGGVSFNKGCYPGQEVVARTQFRGTLKRRAVVIHSSQHLKPGDEIFTDMRESVGLIVQAEKDPNGEFDAIACLQTSATKNNTSAAHKLFCGETDSVLTLLPLPYALNENQ